jgi:hypothetical protein
VFVGFRVDAQLSEYGGTMRHKGSQQMDPRDLAVAAALQGFAIQRDGVAVALDALHPGAQDRLKSVEIQHLEEFAEGGLGGGFLASEAQSEGECSAMIASELGDGFEALFAGQEGNDSQGEDGGERVNASAGVAGVRDGIEEFEERRG